MALTCPGGKPPLQIGDQQMCPPREDPACAPPLVPAYSNGALICVPNPTTSCKVFIEYAPTDPNVATTPSLAGQPGCDAAGMELALAVVLARMLGR